MSQCPTCETILGFHGGFPIVQGRVWGALGVLGKKELFNPTNMVQTRGPKFRGWLMALGFFLPQALMLFSFKLSTLVIFNIL